MFFRIWFLYLCKVALLAFVVAFAAAIFPRVPWLAFAEHIAVWILGVSGVIGALLTVPLLFFAKKIACPICIHPSEIVICGKNQPGVECPRCGLVYARNLIWSFRLCREPIEPDASGPPGN